MRGDVVGSVTLVLVLVLAATLGACSRLSPDEGRTADGAFTIVETGIPELQTALASGRVTSRQLVTAYLARIATYEDRLNAVITVNPRALEEADRLDQERAAGRVRGPLHGIPIALKDNIQTTDIRTTGGALAFRDLVPPYDATLTTLLREGGAIIIAKTVLTELAHWTAGAPTPMVANYTAGPMARTVADTAILMGALEGSAPDPNDAATTACTPPANRDYTAFLEAGALKGARIGIPRAFYYDPVTVPGDPQPRGGLNEAQAQLMADAIALLKARGAEVVDPVEIPSLVAQDPGANFLLFEYCQGAEHNRAGDANCTVNFKYGMKRDFNAWLASLGAAAPVKTLTELREWNRAHADAGAMRFGQSRLDISDEMDVDRDRARNEADMAKDSRLSRAEGLDAVLEGHKLDAILTPGSSGANMAARANYPIITVPFGLVPNAPTPPFPDGFNARPMPFGVAFTGRACAEPRLIALAYAFERASRRRVAPTLE